MKAILEEGCEGFGLLYQDDQVSVCGEEVDEVEDPELTTEEYVRALPGAVPASLTLSLICKRHSLWGHRLWNAAIVLAEMIDVGEISVEGKTVLELGAGAGLPGLICGLNGAKKVVISDYATSTDQALMVPIKMNIERVQPTFVPPGTLHGVGHVWGHSVEELLDPLSVRQRCRHSTTTRMDEKSRDDRKHFENDSDNDDDVDGGGGGGGAKGGADGFAVSNQGDVMGNSDMSGIAVPSCNFSRQNPREGIQSTRREGGGRGGRGQGGDGDGVWDAEERGLSSNGPGFDILILADLLFNRSQHVQLLETCARSLARLETAEVWVSFSHHDPEKSKLDMNFFELASLKGFASMPIKTVQRRDLFVENDGLDELRGEVHLWRLTRKASER